MISCIICSQNKILLGQVSNNIEVTIGVSFEIIAIENQGTKKGICEAYNYGAKKAKFPFLCFIHEDVLFDTFNWGEKALAHFENNMELGLIGVAGCKVKSDIISTWYATGNLEFIANRYNYIQCSKSNRLRQTKMYLNPNQSILSEVVCLDGVFLFAKKQAWEIHNMDDKVLKNFHCYDLDFSLSISQTHKVGVVYDILLRHYSDGFANHVWVREALKFHKKWQNYLPTSVAFKTNDIDKAENDLGSFNYFMDILRKEKSTWWLQLKVASFFLPRMNPKGSLFRQVSSIIKEIIRY